MTDAPDWSGLPPLAAVRPERYGPGYQGAAGDDWGPAFTAAFAQAQAIGGDVQLVAATYGFRTSPRYPAPVAGKSLPGLIGIYGRSVMKKLADVTLFPFGGSSLAQMAAGVKHRDLVFDGGNNAAWTAPLLTNSYSESCRFTDCTWQDNYGPAITARCAWDTRYPGAEIVACGATDGVNPAVLLYSQAGDGGNATNNQWFESPRIEDYRTGAVWCVGASANDRVTLCRIVGTGKLEISNGQSLYGPAIKLAYASDWKQDALQLSVADAPGAGQATPLDAFLYVTASRHIDLGRMGCYLGNTSSSLQSLFHFDGSTSSVWNDDISYEWVDLEADTNFPPTSLFLWSGGNYLVKRGPITGLTGTWTTVPPTDSGAPSSRLDCPHLASATDANYLAAANVNPWDGALCYDATAGRVKVRDAGAWVG